ncbi:hypothetical protein ABIB89_003182 [Bradyrhizobium sp. JR3.12]
MPILKRYTARDYSHLPMHDRPLAGHGLRSYRCRGRFGWIMIGAVGDDDAMRSALRSSAHAKRYDLQVWDGNGYVPCP